MEGITCNILDCVAVLHYISPFKICGYCSFSLVVFNGIENIEIANQKLKYTRRMNHCQA